MLMPRSYQHGRRTASSGPSATLPSPPKDSASPSRPAARASLGKTIPDSKPAMLNSHLRRQAPTSSKHAASQSHRSPSTISPSQPSSSIVSSSSSLSSTLQSSSTISPSSQPSNILPSSTPVPIRKPPCLCVAPAASASSPRVIPTRSPTTRSQTIPIRRRVHVDVSRDLEKDALFDSEPGQPLSLAPSMASLLAATNSIPSSRRKNLPTASASIPSTSSWSRPTAISAASATPRRAARRRERHWQYHDTPVHCKVSSASPRSWSILQSPPDHIEGSIAIRKPTANRQSHGSDIETAAAADAGPSSDPDDDWSVDSGSVTVAPLSSLPSLSSDSMPSLETDLEGSESSISIAAYTPRTPAYHPISRRLSKPEPRISPATPVSPDAEHPLAAEELPPMAESVATGFVQTKSDTSDSRTIRRSSTAASASRSPFKSNLTASLRLLRSAARSISNTAAAATSGLGTVSTPKIYTPDLLARSQLTDPTAPLQAAPSPSAAATGTLDGTPAPSAALIAQNIDALPFHLLATTFTPAGPSPPPRISIQMTSYRRSSVPSSATATAPPVFVSAVSGSDHSKDHSTTPDTQSSLHAVERRSRLSGAIPNKKAREPRENSHFLRVVVLEMNMRRAGKLEGEGRARIWLDPRLDTCLGSASNVRGDMDHSLHSRERSRAHPLRLHESGRGRVDAHDDDSVEEETEPVPEDIRIERLVDEGESELTLDPLTGRTVTADILVTDTLKADQGIQSEKAEVEARRLIPRRWMGEACG